MRSAQRHSYKDYDLRHQLISALVVTRMESCFGTATTSAAVLQPKSMVSIAIIEKQKFTVMNLDFKIVKILAEYNVTVNGKTSA